MGWVLPETAQEICWLPPPPAVVSSGLRWMVDADQTQHLAPLPGLGPVATAARWLVQVQGGGLQAKWLVQVQGRGLQAELVSWEAEVFPSLLLP